jgi:hypothetical protein
MTTRPEKMLDCRTNVCSDTEISDSFLWELCQIKREATLLSKRKKENHQFFSVWQRHTSPVYRTGILILALSFSLFGLDAVAKPEGSRREWSDRIHYCAVQLIFPVHGTATSCNIQYIHRLGTLNLPKEIWEASLETCL